MAYNDLINFLCVLFSLSMFMIATSLFLIRNEIKTAKNFKTKNLALQSRQQEPFEKCVPINPDAKQFYALINNVKYPKIIPSFFNSSINFDCLNENSNTKIILLWNSLEFWENYKYGLGRIHPFITSKCPAVNCEITNDKSRLNESDLVLVSLEQNSLNLPKYKNYEKTKWTFFLSKPLEFGKSKEYLKIFNYSSTFATDSYFLPFYYSNAMFKWELSETNEKKRIILNLRVVFLLFTYRILV